MPEGEPVDTAGDGLTTKERRLLPALIVNTGEGKGKTTAAMGLALRAWHQGWSIGVFQFIKSGKWVTGERAALEAEELGLLAQRVGQGTLERGGHGAVVAVGATDRLVDHLVD